MIAPGSLGFPGSRVLVEAAPQGHRLAPVLDQALVLDPELVNRHVLVLSKTGGGKTTRVIHSAIEWWLADQVTLILVDTKGDLTPFALHRLREQRPDGRLVVMDFSDPARSLRYNLAEPYAGFTAYDRLADALANLLPSGRDDTLYWQAATRKVLLRLFEALRAKGERLSLPRVWNLFERGCGELRRIAAGTPLAEALDYLEQGHNGQTVYSYCEAALCAWGQPEVRAVTALEGGPAFRWSDLAGGPALVILRVPEADARTLAGVASIALGQFFDWAGQEAVRHPRQRLPWPYRVVLDELPLLRLQGLAGRLQTARSRNIGVLAAAQSSELLRQVDLEDRDGALLSAFNTILYQPPVATADLEQVKRELGTVTCAQVHKEGLAGVGRQVTYERPLIEAADLNGAPVHPRYGQPGLLAAAGRPPVVVYTLPWYARCPDRPLDGLEPPLLNADWRAHAEQAVGVCPAPEALPQRLAELRQQLGWAEASARVQAWWTAFEQDYQDRLALPVRLAEELIARRATVTELHDAAQLAETDNIQAVLHLLDYLRARRRGPS